MKPIWKSRKVIYAVSTLVASVAIVLAQQFATLTPEATALLKELLPAVIAIGLFLISGHTITDVIGIWADKPAYKDPAEAAHDAIDAAEDWFDKPE